MKKTWIGSLALALLACATLTPAFAAEPPTAPAQQASAQEAPVLCSPAAAGAAAPLPAALFLPAPKEMAPPVCNPTCIYSQCSKNSQCTLMPNGRCVLACPQTGCCVY